MKLRSRNRRVEIIHKYKFRNQNINERGGINRFHGLTLLAGIERSLTVL